MNLELVDHNLYLPSKLREQLLTPSWIFVDWGGGGRYIHTPKSSPHRTSEFDGCSFGSVD